MIRFALLLASCAVLLTGCGEMLGFNPAQAQPNPQANGQPAAPAQPKTPLVRALIKAVDEIEGENQQVKDGLKQSLREADKELSQVLGGNSKRLIMQANQKPTVPTICEKARPLYGGKHVKWEKEPTERNEAQDDGSPEAATEEADKPAPAEPKDPPAEADQPSASAGPDGPESESAPSTAERSSEPSSPFVEEGQSPEPDASQ
jgi:hypothetical protein